MSEARIVSPVGHEEAYTRQPTINELILQLAQNMRIYDELTAERNQLAPESERLKEELTDEVIEQALTSRMEDVAFKSLESLMITRRMSALQSQVNRLDDPLRPLVLENEFHGAKLRVTSLDPESCQLRKFDENVADGQLRSMHSKADEKKGKLRRIYLRPSDGGYLQIRGKMWVWQASPLVSRSSGYEPMFEVEPVD